MFKNHQNNPADFSGKEMLMLREIKHGGKSQSGDGQNYRNPNSLPGYLRVYGQREAFVGPFKP